MVKYTGLKWLIFTGYLLLTSLLGAFTIQARFEHLGTAQGLPNGSVSAIVQDSRGFLWMGTQGGLVRWDGYQFRLFENEPFKDNVLSHNQIQTLFLDKDDILWIGTYGGLNRFDLKTHTFRVYKNRKGDSTSLGHDLVIAVARDGAGRLWAGTQNGLYRLDEASGEFTAYLPDPTRPSTPQTAGALPAPVVRSLHLDRKGRFWVGTSAGGLSLYDPQSEGFRTWSSIPGNSRSLPSNAVMDLEEDSQGTFWIACWGGGLVSSQDPETGVFLTQVTEDPKIYAVNAQDSQFIRAASWGGGLFEWHRETQTMVRYQASDRAGALSNDVVYSFLLDAGGDLWVGTNGGGLNRMSRNEGYYETLSYDALNPESLSAGKVSSILKDSRGRLWVGVYNGGLNLFDEKTKGFKHYRNDPKNPGSIPNNIINVLLEDSRGRLWLGTNDGLARYIPEKDSFYTWPKDKLPDNIFYSIKEHPDGRLWLGTYTQGLVLFNPEDGSFIHYPPDPEGVKGPKNGLVYSLEYDTVGRLWLGTNQGLALYDGTSFHAISYDPSNFRGLSSDTVRTMYKDSQGNIWLGTTGGGLLKAAAGSSDLALYSRAQGLPSLNIRLILQDIGGDLWVGTSSGLAVKLKNEEVFRGLTVFNSLQDRDFHTGAWRDADGDLYFGGANVVYRFNPRNLPVRSRSPRIELSDFRLGEGRMAPATDPAYLEELALTYESNTFAVEFSVLDFSDPDKNLYSFFLEGFDSDWRTPSNQRRAEYTNLPGGTYRLRVKGSNADGVWSDQERVLALTVDSPPYRQPWAWFLYLAVLIGLGYLIASLRGKKVLALKVDELTQLKGELEQLNARLVQQNRLDGLTGIPNRRCFDETLSTTFAHALRDQQPMSIIMIDLDHFKEFNDLGGHLMGDDVLRQVAETLKTSLDRATDLVARYGGEEFSVILHATDKAGALQVADRLRVSVQDLNLSHPHPNSGGRLTISLGVASTIPHKGKNPLDLVAEADKALYQAKQGGRNRVCVAD